MFPFNLLLQKTKSKKSKYFEPLFTTKSKNHKLPTPKEIRMMTNNLSRCSKCHFLIFDNYFSDEIENVSERLCTTCGHKL